jgi:hypothetical protein
MSVPGSAVSQSVNPSDCPDHFTCDLKRQSRNRPRAAPRTNSFDFKLYTLPQTMYKNVQEGKMNKPSIHFSLADVKTRLAKLGLSVEALRESVQRGFAAFASCTPNHPSNYPGFTAWANTVNALRELLYPDGWTRSENGNLPVTMDSAKRVSIIVATGDEYTGLPDLTPSTRSSKGPRTVNVVEGNSNQIPLFDFKSRPEVIDQSGEKLTWILLFHRDKTSNEVRCELSCPVNINDEGQIDAWAERIILPSIPFGVDSIEVPIDVPQTPAITLKIKRKRA